MYRPSVGRLAGPAECYLTERKDNRNVDRSRQLRLANDTGENMMMAGHSTYLVTRPMVSSRES